MALKGNPEVWETGTKIAVIRDALQGDPHEGTDCRECKRAARSLYDSVGSEPLIFKSKIDGVMVELPKGKERWQRFMNLVREVHAYIAAGDFSESEPSEAPVKAPEPSEAPKPRPVSMSADAALLLSELRRIRGFASDRDVDHISYRPVKDGAAMLTAGLPVKAILHAMTLHWEDATRRQAGIAAYDPATEFPGGLHGYLDALVKARVLIYLYGPAGMGKSYWAKALAERLGVEFGALSCNEQATPSWLQGKETFTGFKGTKFLKIWSEGGVFLFDEVAASDPNFLMLINDGLANGVIFNPIDQTEYVRHPDCIIVYADNTLGNGADENYIRNQLDFSSLDRCRMGRALVGYDRNVEDLIFAKALGL